MNPTQKTESLPEETPEDGTLHRNGAHRLYRRLVELGYNLSDKSTRDKIERAIAAFSNPGPETEEQILESLRKEAAPQSGHKSPPSSVVWTAPRAIPRFHREMCGKVAVESTTFPFVVIGHIDHGKTTMVNRVKTATEDKPSGLGFVPAEYAVTVMYDSMILLAGSSSTMQVMAWLEREGARRGFVRGRFYSLKDEGHLESIDCWGHNLDVTELVRRV
ncbi:MAG: hypothetical protein H7Y17_07090 [Chlorobia bacterium]|nr:hypothetical protein [Fimbriimonadaceae bacterium]